MQGQKPCSTIARLVKLLMEILLTPTRALVSVGFLNFYYESLINCRSLSFYESLLKCGFLNFYVTLI